MQWASLARHKAVRSGAKFALLFALLLAPWPGLGTACSLVFCVASGSVVDAFVTDRHLVARFEPVASGDTPAGSAPGWTVELRVLDLSAAGPSTRVPLDLRFPYVAFALLVALVFAAPIERRRKRSIFLAGCVVLALRLFLTVALPLASFLGALSVGSIADGAARIVFRSFIEPPDMLYATPILVFLLGLLATTGSAERQGGAGPRSASPR
jgi:hypothetical protein